MNIDRWKAYWRFSLCDERREILLTLYAYESIWHTDQTIHELVSNKGDYISNDESVICKISNETIFILRGLDFSTVNYGAVGSLESAFVSKMVWHLIES